MPPPIYISYRPSDARIVERIVRRCLQTYGRYSVVLNPEDSKPGRTTIEEHIDNLVYASRTIWIVIGPGWAGLDEYGRFKLSSADIPVCPEVKSALHCSRRVQIVLVNDGAMPAPETVPDELHGLFVLPVVTLHPKSFQHDLNQLIPPPGLMGLLRYFFRLDWLYHHTRD